MEQLSIAIMRSEINILIYFMSAYDIDIAIQLQPEAMATIVRWAWNNLRSQYGTIADSISAISNVISRLRLFHQFLAYETLTIIYMQGLQPSPTVFKRSARLFFDWS